MTQPSIAGQARPMISALDDGSVRPDEIGYLQAHGTGTKANDATETAAIKMAFGAHARELAVSSSKAQLGHLVGAAGAMGFVIALQALRTQSVPPTANLHQIDEACDLDYVPLSGRQSPGMSHAMCNSFGFGGTAVSLVLRAVS
jgi:3-oxoacyl-[acyl-carrier-protein] synthase II